MSDHVFLHGMEFEVSHGVSEAERSEPQVIELDVEVEADLRPAGTSDDLAHTVDYSALFEICRARVEEHTYHLLEALGEAVAADVLGRFEMVERVVVTVRKPGVPLDGVVEYAGVRLERARA